VVLGETDVSVCKWVLVEFEGWCLHSVGAETDWKLVLPPSGCWDSVRVGALSKWVLAEFEGWCLHSVGAETDWKLVLPPSGCWDSMRVGALNKLMLAFRGCSLL
jgi:hypothetical protein